MTDELSEAALFRAIDGAFPVFFSESTASTNALALQAARRGAPDALFIADTQTAGRGRRGHTFLSPKGAGLYMTLLRRTPPGTGTDFLTVNAAVAVCRAIESLTPLTCGIKWVNDVLIGERKVAGILAEGVVDARRGTLLAVAIGVGLNVRPAAFPPEIAARACSLADFCQPPTRTALAAEIARRLYLMPAGRDAQTLADYRARSVLIGRRVEVLDAKGAYPARAVGIDEDAHLLVIKDDGTPVSLFCGDVSVKPPDRKDFSPK